MRRVLLTCDLCGEPIKPMDYYYTGIREKNNTIGWEKTLSMDICKRCWQRMREEARNTAYLTGWSEGDAADGAKGENT